MSRKTAVVTGASRGIGLAIARRLLAAGWQVFGLSRSEGPVEEIPWIPCDVSVPESVNQALESACMQAGRLDLLVCNAGMGISGAVEFTSEEDAELQIDVNLMGAVRCARKAASVMRKQGFGKIIFISSLAAIFPLPFQSLYSASKAGINVFSDALGIELRPFGVQTCTVMLNDVRTDFTDSRKKTETGDSIYGGAIRASVEKMERSERNGMTPERAAEEIYRLAEKKKLPAHRIVGASNQLLGLLYRILPTDLMLSVIRGIYG